jgi:hypothetical protein
MEEGDYSMGLAVWRKQQSNTKNVEDEEVVVAVE